MGDKVIAYRRLFPDPGEVAITTLLQELREQPPPDGVRPHTLVNFIVSADGRAAYQGRSGALGDAGDHALFHGLREHADAVLAGTSTMRTERYGRILGDAERRHRRVQSGRRAEPLACVLTRSGDVPLDIPLFADTEASVVIFSGRQVDVGEARAQVDIVQLDPTEVTVTTALRRLRSDYGVRTLLCEGGPTLFGAMLHEGTVDELFLTVAPKLTGGGHGPTIVSGPELPELQPLSLRWVLERDGSLFLRYALDSTPAR
jgi:riboflavin biosynthesis pyrimidine reductase